MNDPAMSSASALPEGAEDISNGGFNLFAGPFYRLPDDGEVRRFAFIVLEKHMNSAGGVHGGLLMTFADIAMSRTSRLATQARSCATIALNCDFAGAGKQGELIEIRVRVTRKTRNLVFLSGDVFSGERPLMTATGLWRILQ
ncbi:MAG: PaaI family thioesterase [Alphaproteobacteria bacterium]|nr:PaaI family thioesterase [Alphaproteobacteria bacterium]